MMILVFLFDKVGKLIARCQWRPEIVKSLRGAYEKAIIIVEQYDQQNDQIERKDINEKNKKTDFATVDNIITTIESLFDIPHDKTDSRERLDRLKSYFE